MELYDLKTEYKCDPLGMDAPHPRFSYKLRGCAAEQSARRIIVQQSDGTVMWDSGWQQSAESIQIVYSGKKLQPHTRYFWRAGVRMEDGCEFLQEKAEAFFETGFAGSAWQGAWIGAYAGEKNMRPVDHFRKKFTLKSDVIKARLFLSALGLYEAELNGVKVGNELFAPGWTDYYSRVQYQVYDAAELLHSGENTLQIQLADGWYSGTIAVLVNTEDHGYGPHPLLRAELHVELADGRKEIICSDTSWECSGSGAIRYSDIYMGEYYDARLEEISDWHNGVFTEEHPEIAMDWQEGAPVRVTEILPPQKITRSRNGCFIVDFGQNITGSELLKLPPLPEGTQIRIRHGEMLQADGSLYVENLRSAKAETIYISKGKQPHTYAPRFTFYGFRYLEITGLTEITPDMVSARVIHSDLERTGYFSCSDGLLNRLYENARWGQRGNFLDIPTDCPQRDERQGWSADTQIFAPTASFNYFTPGFYTKWLRDLNACRYFGAFPEIAPYVCKLKDPAHWASGWSDAGLLVPWELFKKYGDTRLLEEYAANMAEYLDVQEKASNGTWLVKNARYGDWLGHDVPLDEEFLTTAYFAGMTRLFVRICRILGQEEEAMRREEMFGQIKAAFLRKFYSPSGELLIKTQSAALLALRFELLPENDNGQTLHILTEDIRKRDTHLSTGFLGTPLLLETLSRCGKNDLALELLMQKTYPSWLYSVIQGATTFWERWDSWTAEKGFGDVTMNSFNHYAYGAVAEFFYRNICGIQLMEEQGFAGGKQITLSPVFTAKLQFAAGEYESMYGRIISRWEWKNSNELQWHIAIPCNSSARVELPAGWIAAEISENTILPSGEYHLIVTRKEHLK